MSNPRNQELRFAYAKALDKLMQILYEEDPSAMGRSIGAPLDEYSSEAQILMVALRNVSSRDDAVDVLKESFPNVTETLVDRVFDCWKAFEGSAGP